MKPLLCAEANKCGLQQENKRTPALKSNLQERGQEFWKCQGHKPGVPRFAELGCSRKPSPAGTDPSAPLAPLPPCRPRSGIAAEAGRAAHPAAGAPRVEGGRERERERSAPDLCARAPSPRRYRTDPPYRPWRQSGPAGAAQWRHSARRPRKARRGPLLKGHRLLKGPRLWGDMARTGSGTAGTGTGTRPGTATGPRVPGRTSARSVAAALRSTQPSPTVRPGRGAAPALPWPRPVLSGARPAAGGKALCSYEHKNTKQTKPRSHNKNTVL